MKRSFVQVNGILYERGTEPQPEGPMIVPDIKPYRSMIDGHMVTSRSEHREHLKAHGYEEVGNEVETLKKLGTPNYDVNPTGRKELIRSQIDAMRYADFKRALRREIQRIKWNSRKD